jgi:hypothetical protein
MSAGCSGKSNNAGPGPEVSSVLTPSAAPLDSTPAGKPPTSAAAAQWPTPEDCVTYNPNNVTKFYEAGVYVVRDGSRELMRFSGGPAESLGQQGLALAQRYKKHCYIGKGNMRGEDKFNYTFDYWRDPSGMNPSIPDEDCTTYNKNNLTVENMGGGDGWRVKEHDHVLQLFDNETDARNGKLVLVKYSKMCFVGHGNDGAEDIISYFP